MVNKEKFVDQVINASTLVVLILVAFVAIKMLRSGGGKSEGPESVAVGTLIAEVKFNTEAGLEQSITLRGRPHLLYLFRTTCPVCEAQRESVEAWLGSLPEGRVITASGELQKEISKYWDTPGKESKLSSPVTLHIETARALKAAYVPYIVTFDANGLVTYAYVGPFAQADTNKIRSLMN